MVEAKPKRQFERAAIQAINKWRYQPRPGATDKLVQVITLKFKLSHNYVADLICVLALVSQACLAMEVSPHFSRQLEPVMKLYQSGQWQQAQSKASGLKPNSDAERLAGSVAGVPGRQSAADRAGKPLRGAGAGL